MANTYNEHLIGQTLHGGEYLVQRVLGHGGMGRVYFATHTTLQTPFALKQARADQQLPDNAIAELEEALYNVRDAHSNLDGSYLSEFPASGGAHTDRFIREALLLTRLHHRAIPTLYDYFFEDGYWYLVMDYIPGSTLAAYLRKQAPLSPLEALNYALQLCDVLEYLHNQSPPIIFRDLKPSNIIVIPDGTLMLIDFGIARYFKRGQINDTGDFGSPGYASPEQYHGDGQTDERSDLYSLGVLLHEMITGTRPFASGSMFDPPRHNNPAISAALSGLVTLATRSEPQYRFQSAHIFYQALERVYGLEERRAYERYVLKIKGIEQATEMARRGESFEDLAQYPVPVAQTPEPLHTAAVPNGIPQDAHAEYDPQMALDLEQRQQTREALLYIHRQRREQLDSEMQLISVDESLQRRAYMPLSYSNMPSNTGVSRPSSNPPERFHKAIKFSFLLTLIVSIVLASLLSYMHTQHQTVRYPIATHGQLIHSHKADNIGGNRASPPPASLPATHSTPKLLSSWQGLPALPRTEADNTATYVKANGHEYVYMNGGYRGPQESPFYDRNLYRYDIHAARWEQVAIRQFPGMLNNTAVSDGKGRLFFTAGYATDTYAVTSLLYAYQTNSNTVRTIVPPTQIALGFGTAMVIDLQGHLFITQGYLTAGNPRVVAGTDWYRYDIATGNWHTLSPLPTGLGYVVLASSSDGNIFLQGGATDAGQTHQSSSIYKYNIAQNRWTQMQARTPLPLSGATSCLLSRDNQVVVGGYDATRRTGRNLAWLVNLRTLRWTRLRPLPAGGSLFGGAACDGHNNAYLVRGASDQAHPTDDFWRLTLSIQG
jgi:serine/threonine protein kinase/N-acetylneuraminic acid mutarotase